MVNRDFPGSGLNDLCRPLIFSRNTLRQTHPLKFTLPMTKPSTAAAFGAPGINPRWTRSDKDGIISAYSASSRIWATLSAGIVNEVYSPSIDSPQIRDLQYLLTDGETFFHDERRHTKTETNLLFGNALGYRITNCDPDGRYTLEKQIIAMPHADCLLIHTKITIAPEWLGKIKVYALLAPHLGVGGNGNSGHVECVQERKILTADRNDHWLAMDCCCGFAKASCGYVGTSDGWTDLSDDKQMIWEFTSAPDGNIALMGEVRLPESGEFCLAVSFSQKRHGALATLAESLAIPFADHLRKFHQQWERATIEREDDLVAGSFDNGYLLRMSHNLLLAHEDKTCHGAMIASLSIPWGEVKGDEDLGGYHLVWTRDMVNSATGLMAAGETATPLRALIYLASTQLDSGGFYQNFWIDGQPYWQGIQLDEVAFPIVLAWRLKQANALELFDPYPMVKAAAAYLAQQGPATPQERWEENSGYSPSTLAAHISGLVCASLFAAERGDESLATYFVEYADFLEQHLERWTVTNCGTILPDVARHYIRMLPIDLSNPTGSEDPNTAEMFVKNRASDLRSTFPARDIVDAGFLELVRYGIRPAEDLLIADSLKVVDKLLKTETPNGPCWRRYPHDGYGQRADGGPFNGVGQGRTWPLLTGERAHYELATGADVSLFVKAMEAFAGSRALLPEQVWDEPNLPEAFMKLGFPTGSAMPLMWAHAEYLKLLRSIHDGQVFDRIDAVYNRYCNKQDQQTPLEIWKFNRQPATIQRGETLRVQADNSFRLRWTRDNWITFNDSDSNTPGVDIHFADIAPCSTSGPNITFTFWWVEAQRWEQSDFQVVIR